MYYFKNYFMLSLFLLIMTSCSSLSDAMNKGVHKKLDEKLEGKLKITKIKVTTAKSLNSMDLKEKVDNALKEKLSDIDKGKHKATMHVEILGWEQPKDGAMSKVMGSVAKAHGRAKFKDSSGKLLAEYEFWVEDKQGGLLGGTINFSDAQKAMLEKFVYFAFDGIQ